MRSTVIIDDHLFKLAKKRAADLRTSLSEVINQALRETLTKPPVEAPRFEMMTFGASEPVVQHEPADLAASLLAEDARALGR